MSEHLFTITSYIIPASHIRGYSRGIQDEQTNHLRLSLKHYLPKGREAKPGDPTLILAHGIGSSKESYEPFLDELLTHIPIRGAWACDVTHHGASYLLNEDIIGDEPHWLDSARDLVHMVNTFAAQMPPPIYGIGQSWGCNNIVLMSHLHQRLLAGMVLIEPFFGTGYRFQSYAVDRPAADSQHRISLLARRRDTWTSREEAAAKLRATPYYAVFDPRVFERVVKYDLRDMPTRQHPHAVTLTTPKAQEVYNYAQPDPPFPGYEPAPGYETRPDDSVVVPGFYRAEVKHLMRVLPQVQPPLLFLWGTESDIGNSAYPQTVIDQTGVGDEGNGGVASGKVQSRYVKGAYHAVHLELPGKVAEEISEWLKRELGQWHDDMLTRKERQPSFNPGVLNPLWLEKLSNL